MHIQYLFFGYICHKSHKRSLFFSEKQLKAYTLMHLELVTVLALEILVSDYCPLRLSNK